MHLTPLAHGTEPGSLWAAWAGEPLSQATILLPILLAGWCYARGTSALWRRLGRGRAVSRWQVLAWWAGTATLVGALVSPLEALTGWLFSAHMAQHVLLTTVAAPLLVLSRPTLPLMLGLPHGVRRRVARWLGRLRALRRLTHATAWPLAVAGGYSLVLFLWHLPGPYEAALRSDVLHALEHVSLLGVALALWWVVRESGRRSEFGYGAGILVIFVVGLAHTGLGALLIFAPNVLYGHYAVAAETWGVGALTDQNLAGITMWAPDKLVHGVVVVVLAIAWLRAAETRAEARAGTGGL